MFTTLIDTLLGTVPEGYEFMRYLFAGAVAAMVVRGVLALFSIWRGAPRV